MNAYDARSAVARKSVSGQLEWWRGAVIYQIYPRSFLDSTGDGVGDLAGILTRLDYVASLGVDGVWLSPFFKSPMRDFGYDVADYESVDPIFGALEDFDRIIEKAHKLGLKVIIDQVYSHTSDTHAWFSESRSDQSNSKADWYVWADPRPDGTPPNNWQSVFGGPAWRWDSRRQQYYMHNFLPEQPDLNLHNPEVQNALIDVARFWLDRGVDGFRLDAINFAMHDPELRDNPPASDNNYPKTRPFDYQVHSRNMSHPDIPQFLEKLRAVTDEYSDIFTVAEVGGANPLQEMKAFTADDCRLNSAYNFDFLYARKLTPKIVSDAVDAWHGNADEGWPAWAFSNHDAPRAISRWADQKTAQQAAKLYLAILLSLRGNAFIYQGEELGLPQADVPFELLQDPEAIENWPLTLGRDGARTPMPWQADAVNAGFTSGTPWLPIGDGHALLSVEAQDDDPDSMLNFSRKVIALRKSYAALRNGAISFTEANDNLLVFKRKGAGEEALCVFNLGTEAIIYNPCDTKHFRQVLSIGVKPANDGTLPVSLEPLSGYIAVR